MIPPSISSSPGFPQSTSSLPSMAINQNSVPIRNPFPSDPLLFYPVSLGFPAPVAGDPADDFPDDHSSSRKVKFLCSFGGRILPRPSDGALRYAGGQTRIIAVHRSATLPELIRKMEDAYGGPVAIRYQLPDVDLDALVSVSSAEDLVNMMEEYDKLAEGTADGYAKLRVFLFSPSDITTDPSSALSHVSSDTGQQYFDAVNGICSSDGSLWWKDSFTSGSSTQNSDGPLIEPDAVVVDGTNEGMPSDFIFGDPSGLFFAGASNPVSANPMAVPDQTLNLSWPELLPLPAAQFSSQAFVDSNQVQYMNSQSFGISAGSVPSNVVAIPSHSYVQFSTDPMVSQTGNANPIPIQPKMDNHLEENLFCGRVAVVSQIGNANPIPIQPKMDNHLEENLYCGRVTMVSQIGNANPIPIQPKMDNHLEENLYCGRVAQFHSDPNYNAFQPLSQFPPLPPSYHQPQNGERYGLCQDYCMCHKARPHTHSDPLVQDHGNGPGGAVREVSRVFESSYNPEDAARLQAPQRVVAGGLVVPKAESTISAGHFGAFEFTPETHAERFDQGKVLCPPGAVGLSGDIQASHGMFVNHPQSCLNGSLQQHQQLPQASELSQFHVKQDAIAKPYSNGVYPVKSLTEPLSRESVLDTSYDYVRPIEGMMEALQVNPFETPVFNGNWKPIVTPDLGVSKESLPETPLLVVENSHTVRPQVGGNTMSVGNAFSNPQIIPEGSSVTPVDQLSSSSLVFSQLHNLQPAFPSQVPTLSTYLFNQEKGVEHRVPNEHMLGNWRDEASLFHLDLLHNVAAPPGGNVSFPLSNSGGTNGHVEQFQEPKFQEPLISDSLFCNDDPRKIMGSTHLLPPMPSWVASGEPVVPKDLSAENCLVNIKGSGISVLLEEGVFHKQMNSLNKDSFSELSVLATEDSAEEQIKQELQAVAEGVAASVLESSVPSEPVFFAPEATVFASQSNEETVVIEDNFSLQSAEAQVDHIIEDITTKQSDNMNHGFPITDDIGHLQIIKNSDLEELRELGSGTFGTVYHGKWRGSDVAIKRINDRCFAGKPSDQERMRTDFWNEACKLADLHHPNVVAFYGLVLDSPGGSVATVTEYMVSGSLRQVLQKNDNRTLDRRKRMLIAMDVAFGMEYLHGKNIVHFDLKSDNLLVNLRDPQRPICKVGDLGLSKVKCQTLISGGVRGTLPWMAPELLNGSSNMVSEKVDVFSFGIVMWELLTGEEPYADLHYGAIIGGIVNNTLRPPVPDSCDPEWRSLMEKCWSAEPSERPSFTEIANRLRAMAASLPLK